VTNKEEEFAEEFAKNLMDFDLDYIPPKVMKRLIAYCDRKEFDPDKMDIEGAAALCRIVRAVVNFDKKARGH
jgi:hypothetical protein